MSPTGACVSRVHGRTADCGREGAGQLSLEGGLWAVGAWSTRTWELSFLEGSAPAYLTYKSAWYFFPFRTPSRVGFSLFLKLSVQSYTAETIKE